MANRGLIYGLLILGIIAVFFGLSHYLKLGNPLKADFYLDNSRAYLVRDYDYDRSHRQLEKAIKAMREMEAKLDEESTDVIENAIKDLEIVLDEINHKVYVKDDLNLAYMKALDALTYAEIKISEHLLEQNDSKDAIIALKYGRLHIQNALKYSQSKDLKDFEIHVYEELDSVIAHPEMDHDMMKARLDKILEELNYVVRKDSLPASSGS